MAEMTAAEAVALALEAQAATEAATVEAAGSVATAMAAADAVQIAAEQVGTRMESVADRVEVCQHGIESSNKNVAVSVAEVQEAIFAAGNECVDMIKQAASVDRAVADIKVAVSRLVPHVHVPAEVIADHFVSRIGPMLRQGQRPPATAQEIAATVASMVPSADEVAEAVASRGGYGTSSGSGTAAAVIAAMFGGAAAMALVSSAMQLPPSQMPSYGAAALGIGLLVAGLVWWQGGNLAELLWRTRD